MDKICWTVRVGNEEVLKKEYSLDDKKKEG
jgi:hypothetical protein